MQHHERPIGPELTADELLLHGAWLRRLAAGLTSSDDEADDLVQETWFAALTGGPAAGESTRPWLAQTLRRRAAMLWRAKGRRRAREWAVARDEALPSAAVLAGRADRSRRLVELVLELPSDPQRIPLLRYFEGLTSAEIARRLGRPPATVRSQLARGLARLRERLDVETGGRRQEWMGALAALPTTGARGVGLVLAAKGVGLALVAAVVAAVLIAVVLDRSSDSTVPPPGAGGGALADDDRDAEATVAALDPAPGSRRLPTDSAAGRGAEQAPAGGGSAAAAAAVQPAASLVGRVLDPDSGEPVPYLSLGLIEADTAEGAAYLERLRTDLEGRFASTRAHPAGDYRLVLLEDLARAELDLAGFSVPPARGALVARHAIDGAGRAQPLELELAVGPLFVIDTADLTNLGPIAAALSRSFRIPELGWSEPTPVAVEPLVHARFAPLPAAVRRGATHLHLMSVDGRWTGAAPVELIDSPAPQRVAIELLPCGTIDVRIDYVTPPAPTLVVAQAWLGVETEAAIDVVPPRAHEGLFSSDPAGVRAVRLPWVPVGTVTVAVEGIDCDPFLQVVEHGQEGSVVEAALQRTAAGSGVIEGAVVCLGDEPPDFGMQVYMDTVDRARPAPEIRRLEFAEENGVWSAPFRFEHLDDRERYLLVSEAVGFGWPTIPTATTPERIDLAPDSGPVRFELAPTPRAVTLVVRAVDGASGVALDGFECAAVVAGGDAMTDKVVGREGRAELSVRGELDGGSLLITAPGHVFRALPLEDDRDGDGQVELEVALAEGWGAPLAVVDAETGEGLAGVEVRADGAPVGVTDGEGLLELVLGARPERLEVDLPGYAVDRTDGPIFKSGKLKRQPSDPFHEAYSISLRSD